jgi:hypothetical protein
MLAGLLESVGVGLHGIPGAYQMVKPPICLLGLTAVSE